MGARTENTHFSPKAVGNGFSDAAASGGREPKAGASLTQRDGTLSSRAGARRGERRAWARVVRSVFVISNKTIPLPPSNPAPMHGPVSPAIPLLPHPSPTIPYTHPPRHSAPNSIQTQTFICHFPRSKCPSKQRHIHLLGHTLRKFLT
jgi:hypothetical protein